MPIRRILWIWRLPPKPPEAAGGGPREPAAIPTEPDVVAADPAIVPVDPVAPAKPATSTWNSLEIAKIAAPIVSAIVLAAVGYLISHEIESAKLVLAEASRAQNSLPRLLRDFSQFRNSDSVDGRRADLRNTTEPYLRVHLKDNVIVEGWPLRYAYPASGYEIWLSPACFIVGAGVERNTGPGVFIFQSEVRRIDILDKESSVCAKAWDAVPPASSPKK